MLQKIWKIVIFHLSLYNKTWDSPTLINLTNLTREVRTGRCRASFLYPTDSDSRNRSIPHGFPTGILARNMKRV